jgi:hypothetical protein
MAAQACKLLSKQLPPELVVLVQRHAFPTAHIVAILDMSGSMQAIEQKTRTAFDDFFADQKQQKEGAIASLVVFNNTCRTVFDGIRLNEVVQLSNQDYAPNGGTALYDAIGATLTRYRTIKVPTICVILTDGQENASSVFTQTMVRDLIGSMRNEEKWEFVYLGANQDSFTSGGSIGIQHNVNYDVGEVPQLMRQVSRGVSQYRQSGGMGLFRTMSCRQPVRQRQPHEPSLKRSYTQATCSHSDPLGLPPYMPPLGQAQLPPMLPVLTRSTHYIPDLSDFEDEDEDIDGDIDGEDAVDQLDDTDGLDFPPPPPSSPSGKKDIE